MNSILLILWLSVGILDDLLREGGHNSDSDHLEPKSERRLDHVDRSAESMRNGLEHVFFSHLILDPTTRAGFSDLPTAQISEVNYRFVIKRLEILAAEAVIIGRRADGQPTKSAGPSSRKPSDLAVSQRKGDLAIQTPNGQMKVLSISYL